jgi:3'-phosphoadenosine 5'-phosphosulfate sulfotransferase (PAPS reductase)/FAD synthetase
MRKKVRHVLGISGGKDSAALAIYMKNKYPELDIEYYTTDTGEELQETYDLIDRLEVYLGKRIVKLEYRKDVDNHQLSAFELLYKSKNGFLPSTQARWCTQNLKLKPFEDFIGSDPVVSYVGIRGDEDREGYISKKPNIQSIFPFRKNIWSSDVIEKVLSNTNLSKLLEYFLIHKTESDFDFEEVLEQPISMRFTSRRKLELLLSLNTKLFNKLTFEYLKTTSYALSHVDNYPLIEDDTISIKEDIFTLLRNSGVGIPQYYEAIDFEVDGQTGKYARSRSGCYFCFFQQKIEWIWLYEQHPELYKKAAEFEKAGYTWNEKESLSELTDPERIKQIKRDYLQKQKKLKASEAENSPYLINKISDLEHDEEGCAACFI